jgi:hypothetical protein
VDAAQGLAADEALERLDSVSSICGNKKDDHLVALYPAGRFAPMRDEGLIRRRLLVHGQAAREAGRRVHRVRRKGHGGKP